MSIGTIAYIERGLSGENANRLLQRRSRDSTAYASRWRPVGHEEPGPRPESHEFLTVTVKASPSDTAHRAHLERMGGVPVLPERVVTNKRLNIREAWKVTMTSQRPHE